MPTASAGSCFPAELLEQRKEQLPEALFASLSGTVATAVATYEEQLKGRRGRDSSGYQKRRVYGLQHSGES